MSDPTDGVAFRRRYKRAKYDLARFSSALPRSRRLLPMTKSKPVRKKSSPVRERIETDEPARVLFEPLGPRYLLSADISPLVIPWRMRGTISRCITTLPGAERQPRKYSSSPFKMTSSKELGHGNAGRR
jgi:hypothetical protein